MQIFVLDSNAKSRALLLQRLEEAARQAGLKHVQFLELALSDAAFHAGRTKPVLAFLGPSYYEDLEENIARLRSLWPTVPLGVVLDNEVYAAEAVELRKHIAARIMPVADIGQMAQLILDCGSSADAASPSNRGVFITAHFKGGVGASTIAAALAGCWARHGLSAVLLDFDDLNPQLTDWARVGSVQRALTGDFLRSGKVPSYRVNELVFPVDGYDGRLVVCGQPELYADSFHFKADVLPGAPSAAVYVDSLLACLREEFDIIVIDAGRSWGIATFAALPQAQGVLLVTDDDGLSLRRTLDNFCRLYRESDDPAEFDLTKWSIILNAYTGRLLGPEDVSREVEELDLFPDSVDLFTIPFSESGRPWGAPGETFYDLAEEQVKEVIRQLAFSCSPFRLEEASAADLYSKIRLGLRKLTGSR